MAILPHLTLSWDGLTARLVSAVPPDRLTSGCPPTSLAPPSRACWSGLAGRRWPVGHGRPTGPPVTGPGHLSALTGDTSPVTDVSIDRFNPIVAGLWPFTAIEPPAAKGGAVPVTASTTPWMAGSVNPGFQTFQVSMPLIDWVPL